MFRKKETKTIFLYSLSLVAFFAILLSSAGVAMAATFPEKCSAVGGIIYSPSKSEPVFCQIGGVSKTEAQIDVIYNSIKCFIDSDCDDGKNNTVDTCASGGTTSATCSHTASQCTTDSQCNDNKPDTHDVCVLSSPTIGICVNRADECSTDVDCDDNDDATDDLCKKEDQRPWMACYNTSNNNQDQNSGAGGLDGDFMTYILIIAILAIGIKAALSFTAEAASIVNKGLSGVTGGRIKSMGQPFSSALSKVRKKTEAAVARPFNIAGQWAKGTGYNIAKGDSIVGKGIRKTSAFMQSRPFSEASLQRQKAKAEQAKKGYGKSLGKEERMKQLNAPTDDEIKEESEKMEKFSASALESTIMDEKASDKERKAAAMALKKISEGKTGAVPDAVNDAKAAMQKLEALGLKNKDGKFDDFNKKEFTAALKALQKPSEAIFKKDSSGNISGVDMAKLSSADIGSIDPTSMDSTKIAAINSVMSDISSSNSTEASAARSFISSLSPSVTSEQKESITQAVFSGDLSALEKLQSDGVISATEIASLTSAMNGIKEGDRNNYHQALMISRKFEGHKRAEAARATAGRFKSVSAAFGGREEAYHQRVMSDMNALTSLAAGSNTATFLDRAVNIFAEHRSDYNDVKNITDPAQKAAALQALKDGILEKVKYTTEVTKLATGSKDDKKAYRELVGGRKTR